jgi:hypothetical protein
VIIRVLVDGDEILVDTPSLELAATVGEVVFPLDPEIFDSETTADLTLTAEAPA